MLTFDTTTEACATDGSVMRAVAANRAFVIMFI
jgi:hypothetical protein